MQLTIEFRVGRVTNTGRHEEIDTIHYDEVAGNYPLIMSAFYVQKWILKKLGNGDTLRKIKIAVTAE